MLNFLFVVIISLLLLKALLGWIITSFDREEADLDERQLWLRYKAYRRSFLILITVNLILQTPGQDLSQYMTPAFVATLNYFLATGLLVIYSLWLEALPLERLAVRQGLNFSLVLGALALMASLYLWRQGQLTQAGHIYLTTANGGLTVLIAIFGLTVGLMGQYQIWRWRHTND